MHLPSLLDNGHNVILISDMMDSVTFNHEPECTSFPQVASVRHFVTNMKKRRERILVLRREADNVMKTIVFSGVWNWFVSVMWKSLELWAGEALGCCAQTLTNH